MNTLKGMGWLYLYMAVLTPFWVSYLLDGNKQDLITAVLFVIFGSLHVTQVMCKREED